VHADHETDDYDEAKRNIQSCGDHFGKPSPLPARDSILVAQIVSCLCCHQCVAYHPM